MTEEIIRQFSIAARYGKQEQGGHLPRVRAAKAARACVVFDRLGPFGFVLYFLIIVGAIVALVHVTSRVADYAIASRAREASAATRTSDDAENHPLPSNAGSAHDAKLTFTSSRAQIPLQQRRDKSLE
jgi:hypothetical protein